jgi:hypothetical protein
MVVRDEELQQHDAADPERPTLSWGDALGHLPAFVIAGGLLLYGYLSISYYTFYGRLGVDPNDVGLSYTGTLARSSGFVVAYLLGAFLLLSLPSRGWHRGASRWARRTARVTLVISFLILGMAAGVLPGAARGAARHVEAGEPVGPVRLRLPFPRMEFVLLAIHADPAYLEPAGKPGESPAVERLREQDLLYLGQSTGTVVLYNPATQEAVYVPASSIILHVSDCHDEPADPPCWP